MAQTYMGYRRLTQTSRRQKPSHKVSKAFLILLMLVFAFGFSAYTLSGKKQTNQITNHNQTTQTATTLKTSTSTKVSQVAQVNYCAQNTLDQLILVSISKQTLWACKGSSQIYTSAVITGAYTIQGDETPTGTWQIYAKETNLYLTGPGYKDWVYYWMPFYTDYGLHDATWRTSDQFGNTSYYATNGSHGCVEMPLPTAAWLYNWDHVGTTVTIEA